MGVERDGILQVRIKRPESYWYKEVGKVVSVDQVRIRPPIKSQCEINSVDIHSGSSLGVCSLCGRRDGKDRHTCSDRCLFPRRLKYSGYACL
jgi:hypothetical protein